MIKTTIIEKLNMLDSETSIAINLIMDELQELKKSRSYNLGPPTSDQIEIRINEKEAALNILESTKARIRVARVIALSARYIEL